jgi:hypothetical protein
VRKAFPKGPQAEVVSAGKYDNRTVKIVVLQYQSQNIVPVELQYFPQVSGMNH